MNSCRSARDASGGCSWMEPSSYAMIRARWDSVSTPCASHNSVRLRATLGFARGISAMSERLPIRDALLSFAARESLRAALFLTYSFDGRWFDEAIIPDLCERPIGTMLVIRDRNAIITEGSTVRY